jgi:hypothetical protein
MNIDSILVEWCYQLPKGYPTTSKDYKLLKQILIEQGVESTEAEQISSRAQGPITKEYIQDKIKEIGLPVELNNQILAVYNAISEPERKQFNKNFRAHTIESFVAGGYKAFVKFFMVNIGGARGGMGNGEICVLLGVAESKPGGTAQHDIVMPYGEWEVKELKNGKFDPAGEGRASKFALTEKIQNFYKDIVTPVDQIGDPYEQLHHLVDPASHDQLKRLIMIFETRFSEAIDPVQFKKMEWKKSAMYNWYEGFKELHDIFYNTKLDTSVKDTRLTVSTDGNQEAYWIDDEDAISIRQSAGTDDAANILIGEPVTDINNDIIIWFKRLARNEFIREPNNFITELNTIKSAFFNNVAGLMWYEYRNPVPHIGLAEDFAIDLVSLGIYRFVLKNISANNGYSYIKQQS